MSLFQLRKITVQKLAQRMTFSGILVSEFSYKTMIFPVKPLNLFSILLGKYYGFKM